MTTSSSSSSTSVSKFDAFLSFRGEDTRNNFTDHLYNALDRKGIHTFKDDEKLHKGTTIAPELLKAIEESTFAIVVLSKNYASSTWCLDELAKIVESQQVIGLTILPIFYDVEPSEVRKQSGQFGKAFDEHEQVFRGEMGKVKKWRKALTQVADVSGWDLKNSRQSEVIEKIVRTILNTLNRKFSSVDKNLVGIDSRIEELLSYLSRGHFEDVFTVGIWGMGGIGKTTLALEVLRRIQGEFEASCFIGNVREEYEKHGLVHLQKILYNSLLEGEANIQNVDMGTNILRNRLCRKRVLIILDDVDKLEHIEKLAGKGGEQCDWFGPGSRIIVTTRDKKLLTKYGSNVYEVKKLTHCEALQMLCKKAFEKNQPVDEYKEISIDVVKYADGLPLALEVLGSSLINCTVTEWSSTLARLREYHEEEEIFRPLRVSFDGLRHTERQTFLDIACFFKGEDKYRVKRVLENCDFYPDIDIKVLIEKALITIVRDKLWMHDLLQELGWKIVRQESSEPGERSRLWLFKDAYHVLAQNKGTGSVEGLFLSLPRKQDVVSKIDPFPKMGKLRLLKIRNVNFSPCLSYLSSELRFLEWHGCPLKSIPRSFQPDKLVELIMSNGCLGQCYLGQPSWKNMGPANKLVLIDLSDCKYLTETPDFSKIPNLERLILKGCKRLSKVHPSIGLLKQLILLNLKGCEYLKRLPCDISLESLEVFVLSGCSKLGKFPEINGNMERLSELHLDDTAIVELPNSIKHLTGLSLLNLSGCRNLLCLPSVISSLTSLETLNLSGCSCLEQLPKNIGSLECLQDLNASKTAIREVPFSLLHLKNLKHLSFYGCKGEPPRSWRLHFSGCLESTECSESIGLQLPNSFLGLSSLRSLDLSHCNLSDGAMLGDLGCLSSLEHLALSGNSFTRIPESINQLSKLRTLFLDECRELQSLPTLPSSATYVNARNCSKLRTFSNEFTILTSSLGFCFMDCEKSDKDKVPKLHEIQMSPEHSLPLLHKYSKDKIYHKERFAYTIPRTRIPDWCSNSNIGSSVEVQLPLDSSTWMGFALYAVFLVQKQNSLDSIQSQFAFHFGTGEDRLENPIYLDIFVHQNIDSYGLCYYVPREWFAGQLNKASCIEASVSTNSGKLEVKMCGGQLIYDQTVDSIIRDELIYYEQEGQWTSKLSHEARYNSTSPNPFFSTTTSPTPFSVHEAARTLAFRGRTSTRSPCRQCCFWLTNEQLQSLRLSFNFVADIITMPFKSLVRWLMNKRSKSQSQTSRTSLENEEDHNLRCPLLV